MIDKKAMEDKHFRLIFWYGCFVTAAVLIYVFLITFIKIPEQNVRFADTALGFFLGTLLAGTVNYLMMGSPPSANKKPADPAPGQATAEVSATFTTNAAKVEEKPTEPASEPMNKKDEKTV